jgi:hypothetical protein
MQRDPGRCPQEIRLYQDKNGRMLCGPTHIGILSSPFVAFLNQVEPGWRTRPHIEALRENRAESNLHKATYGNFRTAKRNGAYHFGFGYAGETECHGGQLIRLYGDRESKVDVAIQIAEILEQHPGIRVERGPMDTTVYIIPTFERHKNGWEWRVTDPTIYVVKAGSQ